MSNTPLQKYFQAVEKLFKAGKATEHSYRPALKDLLEELVAGVTATNEPKRVKCGAPDYVLERSGLTIGYVEAKDVDVSLDKIEKDEQLGRYRRALNNLVLTDYLEFRWYVQDEGSQAEKKMSARLATTQPGGKLFFDKEGAAKVSELLTSFLEHKAVDIVKPEDLAKRMARLAHMIRDVIVQAFKENEASKTMRGQIVAFDKTLLPGITEVQFADMFAQTIAYGLFAARYNHTSNRPFTRYDATREIPKTNPFLRDLFATINGPSLDDEPFIGFVDELAQVLDATRMYEVLAKFGKRTRQEDPIIHFYETFLSQYDPKLRELRGVYYTPSPVISYMVRSVDYLLKEEFGIEDGLADGETIDYTYIDAAGQQHTERVPRVLILDPACGTGTFLSSIIEYIRESYRVSNSAGMWSAYVRESLLPRIFGFELLMAPYAMAHLRLGMQLAGLDLPLEQRAPWTYKFDSDERLGVYLTNSLSEGLEKTDTLPMAAYISDEANEAASVKRHSPVMVVIGNPPYSYESANNGKWINTLLQSYYEVDSKPLGEKNPKGLRDDYVKFIRFAQQRIEQTGYGILAFITNHGYLDNPTFRGMRFSLAQSFDAIYVLDLHGNSTKKERSPDASRDENVFDIQTGVSIGIFIKRRSQKKRTIPATIYHAELWGVREVYREYDGQRVLGGGKYFWLAENDINTTTWTKFNLLSPAYFFKPQDTTLLAEYERGSKITDIFPLNSVGLYTARDNLAIQYSEAEMWNTVNTFASLSSEEARTKFNLGEDSRDWQVVLAQKDIKSSGATKNNIVPITYRPFDIRYTYYTGKSRGFHCMPRNDVMHNMHNRRNLAICFMRRSREQITSNFFVAQHIVDKTILSSADNANMAPLYLYPKEAAQSSLFEGGPDNQDIALNLNSHFISEISSRTGWNFCQEGTGNLQTAFGPEDIFHYMYAIFHAPTYRERYAEFLKIDFPRLPLTSNVELFRTLCGYGKRLVELHLLEKVSKGTTGFQGQGDYTVEKVEYIPKADQPEMGCVWINKTQYFEDVPADVWAFSIGGYQVCQKWLKDRKGRALSLNDLKDYQKIVSALGETITLMEQIDEAIEEQGGWPLE